MLAAVVRPRTVVRILPDQSPFPEVVDVLAARLQVAFEEVVSNPLEQFGAFGAGQFPHLFGQFVDR
jgi:hypothetical protein